MQDEARNPKSHAGRSLRKRLLATAMGAVVAGGGLIAVAPMAGTAEGCTGEAAAYERALAAGDAEALQAFLDDYPACPLTPAAFALLNKPREQSAATPPPSLPDIAPAAGDVSDDAPADEPSDDANDPPSAFDRRAGPDDPGRGDSDTGAGGTESGGTSGPEGGPEGGTESGGTSGPEGGPEGGPTAP